MGLLTNSYGNKDVDQSARLALEQIRGQTNRSPQLMQARSGPLNKAPVVMNRGDTGISLHPRGALIALPGDRNSREYFVIPRDTANNLGTQEGTGAPTTAGFPNPDDYGWWVDSAAGKAYWSLNFNGTVFFSTSTVGGINFTDIVGTLNNDQHGGLGRQTGGGTPHHTNATTAQPGFLSTAFFDRLNDATASATASTLVLRNASAGASFAGTLNAADVSATGTISATGNISSSGGDVSASGNVTGTIGDMTTSYRVSGTKVVGARDTGWTAPTATQSKAGFGNGATSTQIEQNLSAVINALITHGLLGA